MKCIGLVWPLFAVHVKSKWHQPTAATFRYQAKRVTSQTSYEQVLVAAHAARRDRKWAATV